MLSKLGLERPHYGYMCEPHIHVTSRPKPEIEPPPIYADATPDLPPPDVPRYPARHGHRLPFG